MDKVHNVLRDRLICYEPLKDYEAPRIKRYEPNEGIFDWHVDSFDEASAKRALVMFWYLNDSLAKNYVALMPGEPVSTKDVLYFEISYYFEEICPTRTSGCLP